jgi:hypothetical protein
MSNKFNRDAIYKSMKIVAASRLAKMSDKMLTDCCNDLISKIDEEIKRCERTIRPVRLLLSIDAMILLTGADEASGGRLLSRNINAPTERPKYRNKLTCHPSVFANTELDPFQFVILG